MANFSNPNFLTDLAGWEAGRKPIEIGAPIVYWFDAAQETGYINSQAVPLITDFSGNGYNLSQGTVGRQPTYLVSALNGKPAFSFDGVDDVIYEQTSPAYTGGDFTVFTVHTLWGLGTTFLGLGTTFPASQELLSNYGGQYYMNHIGNPSGVGYGSQVFGAPAIHFFQSEGATDTVKLDINGGTVVTGLQATSNAGGVVMGDYFMATPPQQPFFGYIGEVTIFSSLLSAQEISDLHTYFALKYSIALGATYGATITRDTGTFLGSPASMKVVAPYDTPVFEQFIPTAGSKLLFFYAYTDGSPVTSADVEVYYDGAAVASTYTAFGGGWYQVKATITGSASVKKLGAMIKGGKTVYLDTFNLSDNITKLFGVNETLSPAVACLYGNYARWTPYTALQSGNMTVFRVYRASGITGAYVALYADNAGQVGTLLNTAQDLALAAGWNDIPFPSTPIVAGTRYWLGTEFLGTSGTCGVYDVETSSYVFYGVMPTWVNDPTGLSTHPSEQMVAAYGQAGSPSGKFFGLKG